jgi:hypothetical protein
MTKLYPIQVIALDKTAHQALDLADLSKFDEMLKSDIAHLSSVAVNDYHQIFVLSELEDTTMDGLNTELFSAKEPIVLLPDSLKETDNVKRLLLAGTRVIFSPSESLVSVSLSQTLKKLELMFYGNGTEMEIAVDHQDIYAILKAGTISEFYESSGSDMGTSMMRVMNVPRRFRDVVSAYVLFEMCEDFSIMEIAEAMNIVEEDLSEESDIIFATRNTTTDENYVKITCLMSHYYDFANALQKEIRKAESYFDKVSVIVDAYAENALNEEEVEQLAHKNSLHMKDIEAIYRVAYRQPEDMVALLRMMQNENVDTQRKIEAIADVVIYGGMDPNVAEEIAKMQKLSIDDILLVMKVKEEGKLPLQRIELSNELKDKYPDLRVSKSADTFVLLKESEIDKESNGMTTVDEDELTRYENDGVVWFVSKKIKVNDIEIFMREFQA